MLSPATASKYSNVDSDQNTARKRSKASIGINEVTDVNGNGRKSASPIPTDLGLDTRVKVELVTTTNDDKNLSSNDSIDPRRNSSTSSGLCSGKRSSIVESNGNSDTRNSNGKQQKSSLDVTANSLSSNSFSSSISTSSASSSASESSTSSTNSFTNNISITDSIKIVDPKIVSEAVSSLSSQNQTARAQRERPISDQPEISFTSDTIESSLNTDSTSESYITNTNMITVPGDSPSFKRAGSFKDNNYKKQKENYLTEKKRITNDMLTIMREESIIVLADWLKIRGSLKNWVKVYVVLKPGIMLLYKSDKMKSGHWIGTIILNSCQLLERPSKKHGFCFKLFHPLEKSIWASKGPGGETYINVPYMLLPTFYLIFRASSETIGQIWMDAIELTLHSSHLLKPANPLSTYNAQLSKASSTDLNASSNNFSKILNSQLSTDANKLNTSNIINNKTSPNLSVNRLNITKSMSSLNSNEMSAKKGLLPIQKEIEIEKKHFNEISDQHDETIQSDSDGAKISSDDVCSLNSSNNDEFFENQFKDNDGHDSSSHIGALEETRYVLSPNEEFGELGNKGQTEEFDEEGKGLIYCLIKQVRPGMDLSKVVLPTFILEPRSFLEKLTDFYYHSNLLSESINNDDPYERMKSVIKFYLSGFYKKPKGLKKPYNPILGEVFRSYWYNPKTDSKTFYIAEQVSHHPPITSLYVSNRKEGFCIYGTVLARSKFYGNSVSAIMEGQLKLILLNRGEEYVLTMPYANCKGILIGKLTMELGGKISIECVKTGYSAEIEFKLKPLLGGIEASNLIDGKIKFAKETIATLNGKWDGEIALNEKRGDQKQCLLWNPTKEVIESRLKRYIVPIEDQKEHESELLWLKVSEAIKKSDQHLATEEKSIIETKQRENVAERKSKLIEYTPKLFTYDNDAKEWIYNYSDLRPWDTQTDLFQYENDFKIITKTKHDLSKLKNQLLTSPRINSIGLIAHNSTSHLRHSIDRNDAVSNKSTNENSFDLLMQYTEIKQRLGAIEENLQNLTMKFDQQLTLANKPNNSNFINSQLVKKTTISDKVREASDFRNLFTSSNLLVILIAWFIGLTSALVSNKLFKNYVK